MKSKVIEEIEKSKNQYNRLILIVGPSNSGKTSLVKNIGADLSSDVINVNLELSKRLLDMSKKERMLNVQNVLDEIIKKRTNTGEIVLLDNIEILFDHELKIDPLKFLKDLSKNYSIVATWNGRIENGSLKYGLIGHRDYRVYSEDDLITFTMDQTKITEQEGME